MECGAICHLYHGLILLTLFLFLDSGRLVHVLKGQDFGTSGLVTEGKRILAEMKAGLSRQQREPVPFSSLVIGTKCGASDPNSFQYCHPVVGKACDILIEKGATVVLSEDCELVAASNLLAERAATPEIAEHIRQLGRQTDEAWEKRFGRSLTKLSLESMSKDNWVKRSLSHAEKAGSGPYTGFFEMEEKVKGPGTVILNAPNSDLENVTALAAAGCQFILFTTGRGTPVGSPTAITLKITATSETFHKMHENIDLCVANVIDDVAAIDGEAKRVVQSIVDSANGQQAKAEKLQHWEVAIPIKGVTY